MMTFIVAAMPSGRRVWCLLHLAEARLVLSLLVVAMYVSSVASDWDGMKRPQYPAMFVSNWTYTLTEPQNVLSKGWTIWAGFNQSLYYYMSALNGWEQLLTGTKIYNYYRAEQNCCIDDYGWPLYSDYFNNATLIGVTPEEIYPASAEWIGSLYTQPVFGSNVTYFVRTELKSGFPMVYVAANVVNFNASEIMYRLKISYEQPPLTWFEIPSFCLTAPPCSH